jgi:acyl-CoA thioester hydrolase
MSDGHTFEQRFVVRWSDLDANRHLRNTAFSEYAVDTRVQLLESRGFPLIRFEELRFGPILFREDIRYRREVLGGQTVVVNALAAGLSADGSHWAIRHDVCRPDGSEAAVLTVEGAWIHLDTRKLVPPPAELIALLADLPRTPDYQVLRSVLRT